MIEEVNNQGCEESKINIRDAEEEEAVAAAAAISHQRSRGCCTRKKKKRRRAEEGTISEGGEDGERGTGEGDMIRPCMAIGRRDR